MSKLNEYEVRVDVAIRAPASFSSELRLSETCSTQPLDISEAAALLSALSRAIRETVQEGKK